MNLDTTKTFKTNSAFYAAFAASCKIRGFRVHDRINELLGTDLKESGIINSDSLFPGIDNQERTSA